jgi:hypothetical protein
MLRLLNSRVYDIDGVYERSMYANHNTFAYVWVTTPL